MEQFAAAYIEAIADGPIPVRLNEVATKVGISAEQVSRWRNQTLGFREWMNAQLHSYIAHTWPAVKAVAVRFAMRGSIDHMRFLKEIMEPRGSGSVLPSGPSGTSLFAGAVIVNLPQPPAELEGHLLVRGLLDSAQTFDMPAPTSP